MPYTPPSQRSSPASSKPTSPILSRNHSYCEQSPLEHSRPTLPRSVSSTSYLSKHRRSPSSTQDNTTANKQVTNSTVGFASDHGHGSSSNGSIRSSYFLNNGLIPPGAITTPPDSSDDDEDRGRHIGNLVELQEALLNIDVKRDPSPNRDGPTVTTLVTGPPARPVESLSAEARKISHSRSSSEITLSMHASELDNQPIMTSSSENSDDEDQELQMKPPLLRKKSGELVKPALRPPANRRRPSSMPGTPTYHKAVHFNENMEQVRHFLQVDRPIAVSAGSSPVETFVDDSEYPWGYDDGARSTVPEWEIKLTNFPGDCLERQTPIRVERIFLSADHKTLIGSAAVANIAFQKYVVARFTLDYWKTTSEVVAEYNHDVRKKQANDGYDRFNFNIKLADQANLETKTLLLCVRYNVNGTEYWDNNNGMNYQVDFIKKTKQRAVGQNKHSLTTIPRSRHSPPATRPRSMPAASFDDDFGYESKFEFGSGRHGLGESPTGSLRLKKNKRGSLFPDQRHTNGTNLSTRYDFTQSLSAALSDAQDALGSRSGIKRSPTGKKSTGFAQDETPTKANLIAAPVPGSRLDALSSDKPGLQSPEYNELIQKFCFVGVPHPPGSKA